MTMVEKVEGALAKLDGEDGGNRLCITAYRDIARVVIETLREPTDEMVSAGRDAWTHHVTPIWQAMIDAALNEEQKS